MREAERNMRVLDGRLAEVEWLAGSDYSIADVATYGWIWRRAFAEVDFQRGAQRRALVRCGFSPSGNSSCLDQKGAAA